MKVRITHLKAPWPAGALVDQVVHFLSGLLPAWAVGKCVPVAEEEGDVTADHTVEPVAAVQPLAAPAGDDLAAKLATAEAERDAALAAVTDAQAKLADAEKALETVTGEKSEVVAKLADAEKALAAVKKK